MPRPWQSAEAKNDDSDNDEVRVCLPACCVMDRMDGLGGTVDHLVGRSSLFVSAGRVGVGWP